MIRLIGIFLLFIFSLRADWDQIFPDDEDPTLFHHVSVITGNLNLCLQDTVVEGAKSFPLFRTYSSAGALESSTLNTILRRVRGGWIFQGGWNFLPHANLLIDIAYKFKDFKIYLSEPSGNLISYVYAGKASDDVLFYKPSKESSRCSGSLSANTNIGNYLLELQIKHGRAILRLPNGGRRIYKGPNFKHWKSSGYMGMQKKFFGKCYLQLEREYLPSGHVMTYSYDSKDRLVHVGLKNPAESKNFAEIWLNLVQKKDPIQLAVRTSNAKSFLYKTALFHDNLYMCEVTSDAKPTESHHYVNGRKGIGRRVQHMHSAGKFQFFAHYYTPSGHSQETKWREKPEKKPIEADKVRALEAPLGPNGEMITFAQFFYASDHTDVRDVDYHLTRFYHNQERLSSIEYYGDHDQLIGILQFIWEGNHLKGKIMLDPYGMAQFSKSFQYDSLGNVTQETLWGALTGLVSGPFSSNGDGTLSGAEHFSKRYEYLPGFNLPLVEEEENGLTYRSAYLVGTDLLTAKYTCQGPSIVSREFYYYDSDHLVIAEVLDNGTTWDAADLTGVTQRHITRHEREDLSGLIHATSEFYVELSSQKELLLKKVIFAYSPQKKIIQEAVFDAEGVHRYTIHTSYDAYGRVISKTTPLGQTNTFSYDSAGNVLTAKEVGKTQKNFHYDAAGRLHSVQEVDALGSIKQTFMRYDAGGRLTSQIDAFGNVTEQSYDAFNRCIHTQFPLTLDENGVAYNPTVRFSYDLQGNIASTCLDGGNCTSTIYNTWRKPVQITQADGAVTQHFYNLNGSVLKTIYPDRTYCQYTYDPFQRMTSKEIYSSENILLSSEQWTYNTFQLLSYKNPRGLVTYYYYDAAGRKIREETEDRLTSYSYDALGFLETTTHSDLTFTQIHDVSGRVIEQWQQLPNATKENHMWFIYNEEDKKIQATRETEQGNAIDHFGYDRELRLSSHLDPNGNKTEFIYSTIQTENFNVLQKATIDPLGNQTLEIHDPQGRIACLMKKDAAGNTVSKEELFYDRLGNKAKRISIVYHLDTPKNSICVEWEYDSMGRIVKETEGSNKTTLFTYDVKGRMQSKLQPSGVSIAFAYDGLDRITEMQSSDGTVHYKYTYDEGHDPIEVVDLVQQNALAREYNLFGELTAETNPCGLRFHWSYDNCGRCTSFTLPDESSIAYTYQNAHLAEVARLSSENASLYTHHYTAFDPNGHVKNETLINNINVVTTHDLLERPSQQTSSLLEQSVFYGPSNLVIKTCNSLLGDKDYTYDPLNQLTQEGAQEYAFDSLGNPRDATVNECNQVLENSDCSFEYDANGNLLKRIAYEGTTSYNYDALNRLISLTDPYGNITHFFYDAFSRLISEQKGSTNTFYLYDNEKEIGTVSEEGQIFELKVLGLGVKGEIGGTIAIEIQQTPYAPLHDFQGNIIALASADQEIIETYTMNAFGKENSSSFINPWRFCSKRATNGLVYFGMRFYDPSLGRWLTPDPSGFADGSNLYVFVLNSPLNRLDLFGLNSDLIVPIEKIEIRVAIPDINQAIAAFPLRLNLMGKGYINGVPVDWILFCGHWNKLQFTPQERQTGSVNIVDHFQELMPSEGSCIALVTMGNGITTSLKEFNENAQSVSNMLVEGTLMIGLHNPSEGVVSDIRRTFKEQKGKDTPTVVRTRQFMVAISDILYKINPDLLWLHNAHSEGGVITYNAIKGMTDDQKARLKEQLYILGVAPARPLPLEFGKGVTNIYSNQDWITGRYGKKFLNDPNYDIKFVKCRSKFLERSLYAVDHAFLGTTYQEEQERFISDMRMQRGFYDGYAR